MNNPPPPAPLGATPPTLWHTKTPWIKRFVSTGSGEGFWMIGIETNNPHGLAVCKVTGQDSPEIEEANAELIVSACNSHATLLAETKRLRKALEAITRRVPIMGSTGDYREGQTHALEACRDVARSALCFPAAETERRGT